ncbi:uncharacterized protein PITG_10249 [Phytophthora infestans T30-4]|uniref:ribonuclease H n=1 Tax=Phytophthora infestans (strain T30-4) TaxID=403677 RepID=D0NEW3_PHYIT|nr:uncharacterized protein PITG_10249 [Phytophthora infestans T30-4]EEY56752.1 conserved hypothetical protein [Phytophthora infestans T30-4]|eukprot:XP_002902080.1 conserved hypothetical protein [Phytophthora infestans T30-4]
MIETLVFSTKFHGYPNFRMKKFQCYDEAQDFIDYFNEDCESVEDEQNPVWYYAVVVGRCTGIYTDVDQALAETHGYSNAKMTKFLTFDAAHNFLGKWELVVQDGHEYSDGSRFWLAFDVNGRYPDCQDPKHPDSMVAFCDGSALRNGQRDCDAAYARVFPHDQASNVVRTLNGPWATNNRAEYMAALAALQWARDEDPSMLINSMTNWIYKWQNNGWTTQNGTEVKNRDILGQLLDEQGNREVIWRHVRAHTGNKDWESYWNDIADTKARQAAEKLANGYY